MTVDIKLSSTANPTLALIGCGPAGISFMHALALRRNEFQEKGDTVGLAKIPIVTCYERASEPGGVWRARSKEQSNNNIDMGQKLDSDDSSDSDEDCSSDVSREDSWIEADIVDGTNMYEALWTNASKERIEYFDYSYEQHFQRPLPVFMPRQSVLDYIMCRVTRNNQDFFKSVKFNTIVEYVIYDERKEKFELTVKDKQLNEANTYYFDKCIWGAGENGIQALPRSIHGMLQTGGFKGKIMHSADIGNYFAEIQGKSIVMIGDSYSAEDLSLTAIKLGVKHITIYSRSGEGACCDMGSWPMNKVEVMHDFTPIEVVQDGHGLRWVESEYNCNTGSSVPIVGGDVYDLENVDAVIYCTGYKQNISMLDPSLIILDDGNYFDVTADFKMSPNKLSDVLGDVTPSEVDAGYISINNLLYRGILMSNPNMMYILEGNYADPLLEIDVHAHLLVSFITGKLAIPDEGTMNSFNWSTVRKAMQDPHMRYLMDMNYRMRWHDNIKEGDAYQGDDEDMYKLHNEMKLKLFSQDLQDASYPLKIGNCENLNDKGQHLLKLMCKDNIIRMELDPKSKDRDWRTFRDTDPSKNVSLYTGAISVPLNGHWLDVNESDF